MFASGFLLVAARGGAGGAPPAHYLAPPAEDVFPPNVSEAALLMSVAPTVFTSAPFDRVPILSRRSNKNPLCGHLLTFIRTFNINDELVIQSQFLSLQYHGGI